MFLADAQFHLVGEQRLGVVLMFHQEVSEVLAHPFLGRQRHPFSTQEIENLTFFTLLLYFYWVWR